MEDILKSENKQFRLMEDGKICWQSNPTNPLPGEHIAHIEKGEDKLFPKVVVDDVALLEGKDKGEIGEFVQKQIDIHIKNVLEPLFNLKREDEEIGKIGEIPKSIAEKLFENFGIIPREQVEDLIEKLDVDDRKALRKRYVRLGPILVFVPALNKPAAVKLRALLFNLWNGKDLPAQTPRDGIVSQIIDKENVDRKYYQSIGYPVYGNRAIRIDMLDRVINFIYEQADKGEFKAQHKMAEWLGCPIADLYDILESMGHKKIYDPADEKKAEEIDSEDLKEAEIKAEESKDVEENKDKNLEEKESKEQVKPELASFRLKKGKAYFKKQGDKKKFKAKKAGDDKNGKKNFKKKAPFKKKTAERKPKMITAEAPKASEEDSPFAILQQLKK